jgi:hypothetical protein
MLPCEHGICDGTLHRAHGAVEREFPDRKHSFQNGVRQLPGGDKESDGDWQIESRTVLAKWARCQVHHDSRIRQCEALRPDSGANPFASFLNRSVR